MARHEPRQIVNHPDHGKPKNSPAQELGIVVNQADHPVIGGRFLELPDQRASGIARAFLWRRRLAIAQKQILIPLSSTR